MANSDRVWVLLFGQFPYRWVHLSRIGQENEWRIESVAKALREKESFSEEDAQAYAKFVCLHTGIRPLRPEDLLTPAQRKPLAARPPGASGGRPLTITGA